MKHPELPLFSFVSALSVLIPLPWHWRAKNVATLSLIAWLFTVDIIYGVNSIVWAGNVRKTMPIWCDITTKIVVGASYALPISTACICKHLELVASGRKTSFSYANRRRRMIFEAALCFGLPPVFMALHYIVQGHRFDIVEDTGCRAVVYVSIPAILIIWLPPLLFSVVTMVYAAIALCHFVRQRLTFASHLRNSNSAITPGCYMRLIAMVITEMLWGTVLTSLNMYHNIEGRLLPWTSWDDVHYNFSRIGVFPESIISPKHHQGMMLFWWVMPVSSLIFFLFFGFGGEAQKEYTKVWYWCRAIVSQKGLSEKVMVSSGSFESSGPKPLQLVDQKNHPSTKHPSISNPVLVSSSNPSIPTLLAPSPTKPEDQASQLIATEGGTVVDSSDALTVSTLSIYAQPYSSHRSSMASPISTQVDVQPPQHPDIPLSPLSSGSPPPSPTPSVPESVGSTFYKSALQPGCSSSPTYHRPFCGSSVYPVTRPHPTAQSGIAVTIHRQASVDDVV